MDSDYKSFLTKSRVLVASPQNAIVPQNQPNPQIQHVQQQVPRQQVPIVNPDIRLMQTALDSILRRIEKLEQRQEDIRIMQDRMDRRNTALRQEENQRMQLVEERLRRIENSVRTAPGYVQIDDGGPTRVNNAEDNPANQVRLRIPKVQDLGPIQQSQHVEDNHDGGDQNRDVVPRTQNAPRKYKRKYSGGSITTVPSLTRL